MTTLKPTKGVKPTAHVSAEKTDQKTKATQKVMDKTFTPKDLPEGYTEPTCTVGFKLGYTKNLGNFESLRVDISLDMPCYPQEIDDTFAFTESWCETKMEKVQEELNKIFGE